MIDTVIFDLDGTLLNTLEDLTDSVNHVMRLYGLPEHTIGEIRQYVGNGAAKLVARSVPQGSDHPAYKEMLGAFREYYGAHCEDKTAPYDGVMELLESLSRQGYHMAVVSNKPDRAVRQLCGKMFGGYIDVAVGESPETDKKPAPDMVYRALKALSSDASRAVYVGDSEVDIQTAANVPMACVSVAWGFRTREELTAAGAEAERLITAPRELAPLLARLGKAG